MIYIIGHIKPDLDSAVSAVALKYLFDKMACFERPDAQPVLAGPANYETKVIFKKFKTPLPKILTSTGIKTSDRFILVDHNEASQRLAGIQAEQITDIFDHHSAKISLPKAIFINIKPWGSTCTLINYLMETAKVKPSKKLAGLMISAILSDTQGFKSSTTTAKDQAAVKQLNKIAQVEKIRQLTLEIFKAKSSLRGLTTEEILTKDYKLFDFGGKKVFINQIETVEQEKIIKNSVQLIKELKKVKKGMGVDLAVCLVSDVLKVNSKILFSVEKEKIVVKAFPEARKVKNGVRDIGPLLSRKKEIAPAIEKAILS